MKKLFLTLTFALASLLATSAEWERPVYTGDYAEASETDTLYLLNVAERLFYTYGNDYNTHASVGLQGIPVRCLRVEPEVGEDEPPYAGPAIYQMRDFHPVKGSWYYAFLTNSTISGGSGETIHLYTDGAASQPDRYFSFEEAGEGTFRIYAAEVNVNFLHNDTLCTDYYLAVDPDYVDEYHDGQATGTGVVYASAAVLPNNVWAWVSQEDYADYQKEVARYEHAQELAALIEEGRELGVDVGAAEEAYANTALSYDEITAAIETLQATFLKYYEENVSPTEPIDLTRLIANPGFETGVEGWTNEAGIATFETGNWSAMLDGECMTGSKYLNLWNGSGAEGRIYTRLTGLPNGIYVVAMGAYSNGSGAQVFAGDYRVDMEIDTTNPYGRDYTITTLVTDGVLEFGYYCNHTEAFWSCLDNCRLSYYGSGEDAYLYWVEQCVNNAPDFSDARCQPELIQAYNQALEALQDADLDETIMSLVKDYIEALQAVNRNVAAYNALETLYDEASYTVDAIYIAYAEKARNYIAETVEPTLQDHQKGTEEVLAIRDYLQNLIREGLRTYDLFTQLTERVATLEDAMVRYERSCTQEAMEQAQALDDEMNRRITEEDFATNEQIEEYIQQVNEAIRQLAIPSGEASDDNPLDYSINILNAGFEEQISGWTIAGQLSDADTRNWDMDGELLSGTAYLNLWDAKPNGFIFQTLTDIPNGMWCVTANCFTNTENSTWLFAGQDNVLVEVGERPSSGTQEYEVWTEVTNNTLTLGILLYHPEEAAWSVIDNFTATCYGVDSAHQPTGSTCPGAEALLSDVSQMPSAGRQLSNDIYDLSGRRIAKPVRGFYLKGGRKYLAK